MLIELKSKFALWPLCPSSELIYLVAQVDQVQETNSRLRMPLCMGLLRLAPEISRIHLIAILKMDHDMREILAWNLDMVQRLQPGSPVRNKQRCSAHSRICLGPVSSWRQMSSGLGCRRFDFPKIAPAIQMHRLASSRLRWSSSGASAFHVAR